MFLIHNRIFILSVLLTFCNQQFVNTQNIEPFKSEIDTNLNSKKPTQIDKNFVLGKFNYEKNELFVLVEAQHSSKTTYLNKDVYNAFKRMFDEAKNDNIELKIISGTRNFIEQKIIWERKWNKYKYLQPEDRAKKILEYSSMPSTSRHHWGTDIDLNSLRNSYFDKGQGFKVYEWLTKNANKFGFFQVYTSKETGRTGYNLEKWHWSYMPLAANYLNFYNSNIFDKDLTGFKGCELAEKLDIISNYVNGIPEQLIIIMPINP